MDRRTQLLGVALELIDERGVRGASMRELARRAGVDVRTAYYHFESKRDLLRALFEEAGYFAPLDEYVQPDVLARLAAADTEQALQDIIAGNLAALDRGAAYFRLIHVQVLYGDDDARAVGTEMWTRWGRLLETLVAAARIVDGEHVGPFSRMLRSLLWGVFNEEQLVAGLTAPQSHRARAEEISRQLVVRLVRPGLLGD